MSMMKRTSILFVITFLSLNVNNVFAAGWQESPEVAARLSKNKQKMLEGKYYEELVNESKGLKCGYDRKRWFDEEAEFLELWDTQNHDDLIPVVGACVSSDEKQKIKDILKGIQFDEAGSLDSLKVCGLLHRPGFTSMRVCIIYVLGLFDDLSCHIKSFGLWWQQCGNLNSDDADRRLEGLGQLNKNCYTDYRGVKTAITLATTCTVFGENFSLRDLCFICKKISYEDSQKFLVEKYFNKCPRR